MASIPSKIHAIIVGLDKYENIPNISFDRAIKDVEAMRGILIKLGVKEENIMTFKNAQLTTKKDIIDGVASLKDKANRGDPIIFYYSGYIGSTTVAGRSAGMICPYDVISHQGGISDTALVQMFDELAPFCGNNISVLLDCPLQKFDFGNPSSCVFVGPNKAATTDTGGAFTLAMINVLSDLHDNQSLDYMTVQSFSAHVQANILSSLQVQIRCAGNNLDRPLFNLTASDKGHYALVTGQAHIDGRISLNTGAAHGIRPKTVYGIYNTNMTSRLQSESARIGELQVAAINKDDLTATLQPTVLKTPLPPFFFAVEERDAFESLSIFCDADAEKDLKAYSGWTASSSEDATAILKKTGDIISMTWKGLKDDEGVRTLERNDFSDFQVHLSHFQPAILRAARFYSQLAEPSATYLSPTKLLVRLQKVELGQELEEPAESADAEEKNHLDDDNFKTQHVFLDCPWKPEDNPASYTLTITNKNPLDVWLYVYLFDVEGLTIEPCYEASSGTPLKRDQKLVIGTDDTDTYFHHRAEKDYDFVYFKIFVAREPMELTFIRQSCFSDHEDKLRRFASVPGQQADKKSELPSDNMVASVPTSPTSVSGRRLHGRPTPSKWASMTIRIVNAYVKGV